MADVQSMVEYRPVKGFPSYKVGDDGSVWSQYSRGASEKKAFTGVWRKLKPGRKTKESGLVVNLCHNGKKRMRQVHRLVLEAFIGPCPLGMECCHGDGDPFNNHLTNLRWDTHRNNEQDKIRHGNSGKGEKNASAKLNERKVLRIRRLLARGKVTKATIARAFGVSFMTVIYIERRVTWTHI